MILNVLSYITSDLRPLKIPCCRGLFMLKCLIYLNYSTTTLKYSQNLFFRKFYQCRPDPTNTYVWAANERDCPCDTLFSFQQQACVFPFDWIPHCRNLIDWDTTECRK
jgi:hypothetical protein